MGFRKLLDDELGSLPRHWSLGVKAAGGRRWVNQGTLCVLTPESMQEPLVPQSPLENMFWAGEFLHTPRTIPTMEKACQAGKLCAARILEQHGQKIAPEHFFLPSGVPFSKV